MINLIVKYGGKENSSQPLIDDDFKRIAATREHHRQ
jgi:hypothetical protein